jgi:hypothetical protein
MDSVMLSDCRRAVLVERIDNAYGEGFVNQAGDLVPGGPPEFRDLLVGGQVAA